MILGNNINCKFHTFSAIFLLQLTQHVQFHVQGDRLSNPVLCRTLIDTRVAHADHIQRQNRAIAQLLVDILIAGGWGGMEFND